MGEGGAGPQKEQQPCMRKLVLVRPENDVPHNVDVFTHKEHTERNKADAKIWRLLCRPTDRRDLHDNEGLGALRQQRNLHCYQFSLIARRPLPVRDGTLLGFLEKRRRRRKIVI